MHIGRRAALVPLAALLAAAALLLLADLGGSALWEDEADTALFARSIVRHGLPLAWDGRSFVDSDDGLRVVPRALWQPLVIVGTPWLPYYAAAASFALFGESEWAARLPFAFAALGTLALLYGLVLSTTASVRSAFAVGLLLLASTQFLLYGREARSYAPNMLFTLLVLAGFLRLGERRRDPGSRSGRCCSSTCRCCPPHSHSAPAPPSRCSTRRTATASCRCWRAPWVMAATLPWLALSWSAAGTNWTPLESPAALLPRLRQLAVESLVAVPWLGWAIGLPLAWRRLGDGERRLLALCAAWLVAWLALTPLALSQPLLEVVGLRYVCGLLPVAAAVSGVLVARASRGSAALYALLLVFFAATQLPGAALPWLAIGETQRAGGVLWQAPRTLADKLLDTSWSSFVAGLGVRDPGALHAIVLQLERDAGRDDVVLSNFGWDALYWYGGRSLGMRIAPDAPVLPAAERLGLPDYVFDHDHADWLVWRGDNEALLGYPLTLFSWRLPEVRAAGHRAYRLRSRPTNGYGRHVNTPRGAHDGGPFASGGVLLSTPTCSAGPHPAGQGGLPQFLRPPSNRSAPHTPAGSSALNVQALRAFHGLRRDTPGSAPARSPRKGLH